MLEVGGAKPFAEFGGCWSPEGFEIDVRVVELACRGPRLGRKCTPMIDACWSGSIRKKPR
jgi:hypothetical protein